MWTPALLACLVLPGLVGGDAAGNNMDALIQNDNLKFVFVGGKGGVGKTTSSSAIASQLSLAMNRSSGQNRRVLLISTDPAHSLSDAFRMKFSNVPTAIMPDLPNLEVMEVNPSEIMKKELSGWGELAKELGYDPDDNSTENGGIGEKIHSFQQWLSGVPGIDEATALSSAIAHIESGRYDMIVFDTAPTGHTLKLLELPTILQVGLDKLESWQATLWGYWEMVKGFTSGSGDSSSVKTKVAEKLKEYKASIARVATMITDQVRTRFVVVCIAEYLSISETRRLLSELDRFGVLASHVIVNQLVTDFLEDSELDALEEFIQSTDQNKPMLQKALAATKLTSARRKIQSKYLGDLKSCPEVNRQPDPEEPQRTNRKAGIDPLGVLEVPLLPREVTGPTEILRFSHLLVGKTLSDLSEKSVGIESERSKQAREAEAAEAAAQAEADAKKKKSEAAPGRERQRQGADKKNGKGGPDIAGKAKGLIDDLMKDPELKAMIDANPKLADVVTEVKSNPMAAMKYMSDPAVSPFVEKAMGKLMGGGGFGGSGKKRKKSKLDL
eukprot:TRINITY_DN60607_c0_g1_i1.p1 TRINITY_DN60607_c0_g1~~TRINITY_DN60607_c0_g1_i1.p1  ORF type:complete len:555 (+),score=127.70 TRINITY_DN60607_c0_g1_i1:32-1696(+)